MHAHFKKYQRKVFTFMTRRINLIAGYWQQLVGYC